MDGPLVSATNRSLFRRSALVSGLVTQEQIDQAIAEIQETAVKAWDSPEDIGDKELAARLVEMGLLTTYQANQLKSGRTKLTLGPYVITDWIGQGGMGQVFKAQHKLMGREVAVKVLPVGKSTPESIVHFSREIRTQARLDHPNLVRAYDAGHDGNVYYLVTEYIPGTDLRQLVRSHGALSMQQAATIIVQAAQGLQHAHDMGLIHRDVKPGNILVTPDGHAKVSDLGLAGCMHEANEDPRAGKIVGTADYLSPDQIRTPRDITPAADIYSLGCTLYYAVTGKVPFPGGTPREKARRHLEETPWHPKRFNPEISDEFVDVIADMMEKDPKNRTASAAKVIARLQTWAREASPIASGKVARSPWTPPPLPGQAEDELEELDETDPSFDQLPPLEAPAVDAPGQAAQGTAAVAAAGEDTRPFKESTRRPPFLRGAHSPPSVLASVAVALAIAIPLSMVAGAVVTFLLLEMLKGP
jgi:serine/threonine protein kinase